LAVCGAASCWGAPAERDARVRCGAKVVRAGLGKAPEEPRVVVVGDADRWRVKEGEAWTGVNPHEFYFTLECQAKDAPPPSVRVVWPGVKISRVLGASGAVTNNPDGVTFRLSRNRAPTSVSTPLTYGSVHMAIFHNWEVRRAGSYRGGAWPAGIIQAQLNYLFAAREMCVAMGFAGASDPGFNGDIRLYGFESNFPNGHVDHPPHFHIMLGWPGWIGTQAGHFLLDEKGRVITNVLMSDKGKKQENATYGPGQVCRMLDPADKVGFELIVMPAGEGVIMRRAEGQPEYRIGPAKGEGGAIGEVEVSRREPRSAAWTLLSRVRAEDAAAAGRMAITVTKADGTKKTEVITYDVDTGALRSADARDGSPFP